MKFKAEISVMPFKEILDPQGKAVMQGLHNLGNNNIENVRIGKHIIIELDASDKVAAHEEIEICCKKLLANQIMESYSINIIAN